METKTLATDEIIQAIENIFSTRLPSGFVHSVTEHKNCLGGGTYLKIWAACSDFNINNVPGQKVQVVSLCLDLKYLELNAQVFGGNGGGRIYREPNLSDPSEKYLAMKGEKVKFRTPPKGDIDKILKAIDRFFISYVDTLRKFKPVLKYKDLVNYDVLLG